MDVKVLGPLEAHENGRSITPTAGKPRQVLALLALQAGHVMTVSALIEELWGMQPPRSALTTLQTYILQLRRRIESALGESRPGGAKEILKTRYGGYMLNVSPDSVDVCTYERLAAAGNRAIELGDHQNAARLLHSALDVWRGPVLVDVQIGMVLGAEVARLEESRLGVLEARIDADLHLGRHNSLLAELAALTTRHPMNENLCAQYMIALYRAGRQWRALDAFGALRRALVDELGVEPSARIQCLQRAILNSDANLDESPSRDTWQQQLVS